MALSEEWTEYHLTPSGWISGTFKWDTGGMNVVPFPEDRVLSMREIEIITSPFQPPYHEQSIEFEIDDKVLIRSLLEKFGYHGFTWPSSK